MPHINRLIMKFIYLIVACICITSCLYLDNEIVEQRDIVVSKQANRLELGNNCESIDVSIHTQ